VFTGSPYFVVADDESEQTIQNIRGAMAAGASAGGSLLGLAALVILFIKKRPSNNYNDDDITEDHTDAHDLNVEEEDTDSKEDDDDWDLEEFDRVLESTFVNKPAQTNLTSVTKELFPTDPDEFCTRF
jgi:hypothetical protein